MKAVKNYYSVADPGQIFRTFEHEMHQLKALNVSGMPAMTQMDGGYWGRNVTERPMARSLELGNIRICRYVY